jgi:eukaryotic-like serine/threonine-protein kinase
MQAFFSFIKSKQFFIHFALVLITLFLVFFLTIKWLSSYTNHGEYVEVPDFKGSEISTLDAFVNGKEVNYQIIDSIYDPKQKPGIVIRQDPEAKVKVKHNRTVYLYVTGMVAPQVRMPHLVDRSERQAKLILLSYGLRLGKVTEKAWDCNGCVVSQTIDGKEIKDSTLVKKGSVVSLVIGVKDSYYNTSSDSTSDLNNINGLEQEEEK